MTPQKELKLAYGLAIVLLIVGFVVKQHFSRHCFIHDPYGLIRRFSGEGRKA